MRSLSILMLLAAPAYAGSRTGGDSGGGGRLGGVSSGLDKATNDSPSRGGSSSSNDSSSSSSSSSSDDSSTSSCCTSYENGSSYVDPDEKDPRVPWVMPKIDVSAAGFAGVQKVHESDGAMSLELSVMFNRRLRLNAAVSHYFEDQMDGSKVTLTAPSFTIGLGVGSSPRWRLWFELGAVHVGTKDLRGSSSLTGAQFGARLEHQLTPDLLLVGAGGAMLFEDVQASTGRLALRWNHVEAAFRYVQFSVGEALYGPELGFAF
jgi:hypothetical protein